MNVFMISATRTDTIYQAGKLSLIHSVPKEPLLRAPSNGALG